METALFIRVTVRPSSWASSIDLKEAYLQSLHRQEVAALCFERSWPSVQNCPLWLFSGSSDIHRTCQRIGRPKAFGCSLEMDIRHHCYLDDWLILADSYS